MSGASARAIIGVAGLVWGIASEAIYYASGVPAVDVLRDLAIGWIYLYGGLAIWSSRPSNNTGRLMTLVGLTWFIGNLQLSTIDPVRIIGTAFADVVFVCLIALILAYPTGWLETRLDRLTVVILAVATTANNAVRLLPVPSEVNLETARLVVGLGVAIFAYAVVIRRWLVAPARRRTELLPVLVAGVVLMAVLSANLAIQVLDVPAELQALILAARGLAPAAIPLALLVGFYRQSEVRQRSLLAAMPDLMLRFTRDGHVLDIRANESPLVRPPFAPSVDQRIGDVFPAGVVDQVLARAGVAIDDNATHALDFWVDLGDGRRDFEVRITPSGADEVTAIVRDFTAQKAAEAEQAAAQEELRRSRARIIEAGDSERKRLERDLHDGAQQRLVSLSLALRHARTRLMAGDPSVVTYLDAASADLKTALVELRDLARGIHPVILTEAGLGPAIDTLAARSTVPTAVIAVPRQRLSPAIESTAYFVVSEALANVAKYAAASAATVNVACPGTSLRVEVADDGVGGADPAGGSGLRGLTDRVAALGGNLSITSPVGGGTRVVAEIPLG